MKYYLGVDGGGTKTAFALFDENKAMIASYKGLASNHENMEGSFDEAADVLKAGVDELLRQAGVFFAEVDAFLRFSVGFGEHADIAVEFSYIGGKCQGAGVLTAVQAPVIDEAERRTVFLRAVQTGQFIAARVFPHHIVDIVRVRSLVHHEVPAGRYFFKKSAEIENNSGKLLRY